MTPLIQEMAKITPDAHKFIWFDMGCLGVTILFEPEVELLTHMPFERTAICGIDADGAKFVITLFAKKDSVALSGLATRNGKIWVAPPFGFLNHTGNLKLVSAPGALLPPREVCLVTLNAVQSFAESLSEPAIAYRAAPKPTSINRARMKKGKPGVTYEWHTVQVAPAAPKPEPKGGTHASPKLHDRRGHWRTRNGRKHWVRACIVGDPDKGVVEKDYRVGHVRKAN